MARFAFEDRIDHPLEACFYGMRDHMVELVPYMSGVREIRVLEREEVGEGRLRILNEWVSDVEIPGPAARVITPEMLRWLDAVVWDERSRSWDWEFQSPVLKDVLHARGTNHVEPIDARSTRFVITGDLEIDVARIPGVPAFLGRLVRPQVERFILSLVEPRLRGVDAGLARWLDARAAEARAPAP